MFYRVTQKLRVILRDTGFSEFHIISIYLGKTWYIYLCKRWRYVTTFSQSNDEPCQYSENPQSDFEEIQKYRILWTWPCLNINSFPCIAIPIIRIKEVIWNKMLYTYITFFWIDPKDAQHYIYIQNCEGYGFRKHMIICIPSPRESVLRRNRILLMEGKWFCPVDLIMAFNVRLMWCNV